MFVRCGGQILPSLVPTPNPSSIRERHGRIGILEKIWEDDAGGQREEAKKRSFLRTVTLSGARRKTSSLASFIAYCRVGAETFLTMFGEKMKRTRKRSRFHLSRLVQQTVDKLASKNSKTATNEKNIVLFGNGSFKAKKDTHPPLEQSLSGRYLLRRVSGCWLSSGLRRCVSEDVVIIWKTLRVDDVCGSVQQFL